MRLEGTVKNRSADKNINESDYLTKTSVRKTDTEYCNKLEKLVQVNGKNLYMFKNNPCHMSYFGVLLLEVYYLRGGKPCIRF